LAVLVAPQSLELFVSLDWQIGNIRTLTYLLQILLGLSAVGTYLARGRINGAFSKLFPTRKRLVWTLTTLLGSLVFTLVVVESVFRLVDYPLKAKWTPSESRLARFDPVVGWSYVPNQSTVQRFAADGREIVMHFDDIGARIPAPGYRRDPRAPTVIFVGGSFTMGHGVQYEETFVGQIEAMPEFPYQAVNLGVQAFGTDQSLLLLKRHFNKFNTIAVVYTFIGDHIARNANYDRRLLIPDARFLGTKPLFGLRGDGTLYQRRKPVKVDDILCCRLLELVGLLWVRWGPPASLELTRALVREMRDYVEANGATFVVVHWPRGRAARGRNAIFPRRKIKLHLIDLGVNAPSRWRAWHLPGDRHPDVRAHTYVAKRIVEEFEQLDL
jgi:hypothetical protein